jgi:Protein of unknown function (DUF3089)
MHPFIATALLVAACASASLPAAAPPAPDYAKPDAWAAWPGKPSAVSEVPPGLPDASLPDAQKADVFFIHPTTYLSGGAANARYDEPGRTGERLDRVVLRFQASVFNACCRIYAPRYRQAAIGAFTRADQTSATAAFELAYSDVLKAFDYYLEHENHGQPFLIASHSQGSLHAMRLLQERIAGQPLGGRLIAAYVIGYYLPEDMQSAGLVACRSAQQTGCFVVWNAVKADASDNRRAASRLIWLAGRYQHIGTRKLLCVNPLSWTLGGSAPASLNLGALPGAAGSAPLRAVVPNLTGAQCDGAALRVDIPLRDWRGFTDLLSLFGSYHIFDYNLFYTNIRVNARQRIAAWRSLNTR